MDWIRENKVLAGILGVIVAGSLGLGYMLFTAWSGYTAAEEQYLALGNRIAQLKSLPLAPSEDNLAKKKALVEEYATSVNQLGGALLLLQEPIQPKPLKDTEFQAKLKERSIEIKKMATALKVQLPAEFAFGFDPYMGALPPNEAATELSGYLDGVEAIVKLVLGCKVASIDLLERSQIPLEAGGKGDTATPSKSKGKAGSKGGASTQAQPAVPISEKRQISVICTLDQGSLQLLMSRLANPTDMPHFASVRVLRVENQAKEGPVRSSVSIPQAIVNPGQPPPPAPGGDDPKKAGAASTAIKPPPPAPVDSVPVMGQELLKAQMEIDLLKFLPAARGVATTAAPAPRR